MAYIGSVFEFSGASAMKMNRVQFQPGLSLPEFYRQFGTEEQCAEALEQARWPEGFRCPHGQSAAYYLLRGRPARRFSARRAVSKRRLLQAFCFRVRICR